MEHSTSVPNERVLRITQLAKLSFNHPSVVLTAAVFQYFLLRIKYSVRTAEQCLRGSSEQSGRSLCKSVDPAMWWHYAQATTPSVRAGNSPGRGYSSRFTLREILLAVVIAQRDQNIQVAVVVVVVFHPIYYLRPSILPPS